MMEQGTLSERSATTATDDRYDGVAPANDRTMQIVEWAAALVALTAAILMAFAR